MIYARRGLKICAPPRPTSNVHDLYSALLLPPLSSADRTDFTAIVVSCLDSGLLIFSGGVGKPIDVPSFCVILIIRRVPDRADCAKICVTSVET